jgi:hypothetical protein
MGFVLKLALGPIHGWLKGHKRHKQKKKEGETSFMDRIMPWVMLFGFTALEMLSVTLGNYGLTRTPTSIFVVCKTSKILFTAVMAVILQGKQLKKAQWSALGFLTAALFLACFAEGKAKKQRGCSGSMLDALMGPLTVVAGELVRAAGGVVEASAVQYYWPDVMALVSWSAAVGIPMTLMTMAASMGAHESVPPYEPMSDTTDVFVMCFNSPILAISLVGNLVSHVAMDASHILCLKYMDSLTRSLADAAKFAVMWMMGKMFWFSGEAIYADTWPKEGGILAVLGEPWQPHSWLMIPIITLIAYSLLVYKAADFFPIEKVKTDDGTEQWGLKAPEEKNATPDAGIIEGFYVDAVHNRKIRRHVAKAAQEFLLASQRQQSFKNTWQKKINVQKVLRLGAKSASTTAQVQPS